jgi:hypothetical protein
MAGLSVRAYNYEPDVAALVQEYCPPGVTCIVREPLEIRPETPVERFERECKAAGLQSAEDRGHKPWRYCA